MSAKRDEVLRDIERLFADATMPRTEKEIAPPSIDAPYVVKHFLGRTRSEVTATWFMPSLHMEDFTYMTDCAALYYLPPVLGLMLEKSANSEMWIFVHGFLRQIDGKYPYPGLAVLSEEQRTVIADWAQLLADEWADHDWMSKWSDEAAKLARRYRRDR